MKTFSSDQIQAYERDPEPIYFAHIYLPGETLYFSDRNFKFNSHDYEAYLLDIPETVHSIERMGGYLNLNAQMTFRNEKFRSYACLFDFFLDNPIIRKEMDLYVLYLMDGIIPGSDVSTKLHKVSFGEPADILKETFTFELHSILFSLDGKKLFTQINRTNWPNADPKAIGQFENRWIGALRGVPCHCVDTGAVSTICYNLSDTATEVYLTDVDYPIAFPSSGTIQIEEEKMTYTGKDSASKRLIGLTRGVSSTIAVPHKPGAVVWVIQANYKYLIDSSKIKSISNVYISQTRVDPADYTVNLDDNGKSTIVFTKKALNKHGHGQKTIYEMHPISGSHQDIEGTITWQGLDSSMHDSNDNTWQRFAYSGVLAENKTGDFIVNFGAYSGDVPDAIYVVAVVNCNFLGTYGEYFRLQTPEIINIGDTGTKVTKRLKLTTTTVPSQVKIRGHTNSGGAVFCEFDVCEVWLEIERWAVNPSGTADEVLAPKVTVDGEGYQDDGSGTYTGYPNNLITNPSDVFRYMLVGILGRSMSEIDASFETVRSILWTRITYGYLIAALLSKLGNKPFEIFKTIQEQTRLQLREDGGKFYLDFDDNPTFVIGGSDLLPSDGFGVSASSYYGAGYEAAKSCDNNNGTHWCASTDSMPQWVQWDAGAGITKRLRVLSLTPLLVTSNASIKDFILRGSNDGINFTNILSAQHGNNGDKESFFVNSNLFYRYWQIYIVNSWSGYARVVEWELFELVKTNSPPASVMSIDKKIYVGDPVFRMTQASEIRNLIRGVYDLDYSGNGNSKKFGDYFNQLEINDPESINSYGELPEDMAFPAINNMGANPGTAITIIEDVLWWHVWNKKGCIPMVEMICNRLVRKLERGDHFTLYDTPVTAWEGTLWKILEIHEIPENQQFGIKAIKYIDS